MKRLLHPTPAWGLVGLLVAAVLLCWATGSVRAQESGTLSGQVINGTESGPAIGAGISVMLHVFQDQVELEALPGATDAAGAFRFEGLSTAAGRSYQPEVHYLGIGYAGSTVQFQDGQVALEAPVTVYETTDDPGQITIDSGHVIAELLGPVMRISELYLFGNRGDRTYMGSPGAGGRLDTVRIPLVPGTVGLGFSEMTPPDRYLEGEGELVDTEPVLPGQETSAVFFSYHLMVDGDTMRVERSFGYPLTRLTALLTQPGLSLANGPMQDDGPESFQGRDYRLYSIANLAAGSPLVLDLVIDPTAAQAPAGQTVTNPPGEPLHDNQAGLRVVGMGLALLGALGAAVYALAARRPAAPAPAALELSGSPQARRLLAELADVEEAFEAGQMDEGAYRRERAARLEAIRAL